MRSCPCDWWPPDGPSPSYRSVLVSLRRLAPSVCWLRPPWWMIHADADRASRFTLTSHELLPNRQRHGTPHVVRSLSTASMPLAPVIPRLRSLCLPVATVGITMGRVPHLTMGRGPPWVAGLALVCCQTVAATVHCCDTPDDKDDGEEAEDHDVKHGPLDHGPRGRSWRCPDRGPPSPSRHWSGARTHASVSKNS